MGPCRAAGGSPPQTQANRGACAGLKPQRSAIRQLGLHATSCPGAHSRTVDTAPQLPAATRSYPQLPAATRCGAPNSGIREPLCPSSACPSPHACASVVRPSNAPPHLAHCVPVPAMPHAAPLPTKAPPTSPQHPQAPRAQDETHQPVPVIHKPLQLQPRGLLPCAVPHEAPCYMSLPQLPSESHTHLHVPHTG